VTVLEIMTRITSEFELLVKMNLDAANCFRRKQYREANIIFVDVLQKLRVCHEMTGQLVATERDRTATHDRCYCDKGNVRTATDLSTNESTGTQKRTTHRSITQNESSGVDGMAQKNRQQYDDNELHQDLLDADHCKFHIQPENCSESRFFTGAFLISSLNSEGSEYAIEILECASMIVLFNIGLTLHMIGNESGASIHHRRAVFFYKQARFVLHSYYENFASTTSSTRFLEAEILPRLHGAICLNMSHLLINTFCSFNAAEEIMHELECVVMDWDILVCDEPVDKDLSFFQTNVFLNGISNASNVASAA
jgi:hypothetical protein